MSSPSFSFAFSGPDIDNPPSSHSSPSPKPTARPRPKPHQFPAPPTPRLPPQYHTLSSMLALLPSKIAYSTVDVRLDSGQTWALPRRELWDVRVQLMAEAGAAGGDEQEQAEHDGGLGEHDVLTGIYEGGFKSWESAIDLIRALAAEVVEPGDGQPLGWLFRPSACASARVMELGCGTALPSLAIFHCAMAAKTTPQHNQAISFILADYNPTVLQLVTLPNFILAWALYHHQQDPSAFPFLKEAFSLDGELELAPDVLDGFKNYLSRHTFHLSFLSGGWSPGFLDLLYSLPIPPSVRTGIEPGSISLLLGAETIYSPFALQAFVEMVSSVLEREAVNFSTHVSAWVAAKKLYFGVGGSLDDFIVKIRERGLNVTTLREETEGVRRGVIRCRRPE